MIRLLSAETWRDVGAVLDVVDGSGAAFVRVTRKALPEFAILFVHGGES